MRRSTRRSPAKQQGGEEGGGGEEGPSNSTATSSGDTANATATPPTQSVPGPSTSSSSGGRKGRGRAPSPRGGRGGRGGGGRGGRGRGRGKVIMSSDNDTDNNNESDSGGESESGRGGGGGKGDEGTEGVEGGGLRRKYNRLIDDCRKLEKREGFSTDVQQVLTNNIKSASTLFQKLSRPPGFIGGPGTSSQSGSGSASASGTATASGATLSAAAASLQDGEPDIQVVDQGGSMEEDLRSRAQNLPVDALGGGTPGDLYMAFLHTKMISEVLKSKTSSIGVSQSGFQLDEFLSTLKRKCVTEETTTFNNEIAAKVLSMELATACITSPSLSAVVGSFDRDAISVPKEKKPRAPIVRKRFEDVEKTQEEVNVVAYKSGDGPQNLALHLNRILKQHCARNHSKPTSLIEFVLDPGSINKTIESIFYVAFLVHDGVVALNKPVSPLNDFALEVKPEKKTEEEEQNKISSRRNTRNQYIFSISAKMLRKLCERAVGDPIIPPYSPIEDVTDKDK